MTPQHAKELLPIITAFAEGKTIQHCVRGGTWEEFTDFAFADSPGYYRIKPEPKLVPLTHEDLPALFWVRHKERPFAMMLVSAVHSDDDRVYYGSEDDQYFVLQLSSEWEWSPDRKTWHSFTREEEAQ